jgi:ATP-dependent DNA helicase RecG
MEYKSSTADKDGILRSVAAFANTKGGKIRIGVDDRGKVLGVTIGKNTLEELGRGITEELRPAIYPSISVDVLAGKNIIEISVPESSAKPHFYKGAAYLRIGKINKAIEPHALEEFMRKKLFGGYDELPTRAGLDEIEEKKIAEFVAQMRYAGRRKVEYSGLEHTMKSLGVYPDKKLLNAAIMAFGKDPYSTFPQLSFRCVLRRGTETADYLFATGTIFEIQRDVELFLERNLKRSVRIEGYERKERLEIPVEALREALFNSLIHRDYFHPSGNYLEITEEEVLIKNPGVLPDPLHIKDLYERHDSIPRNKILASLAYLAGKIEQWGEGTTKIVKGAMAAGLKQPVFLEQNGFFQVIFKRTFIGEREGTVLRLLKTRKQITSKDAARALRVSERSVRSLLGNLVAAGLIRKNGTTRGVYYTFD